MKGLVHIYTGDGKGKTSAAIGLGIRALGRGLKVIMVQFMKSAQTGEIPVLEKLAPDFELYRGNYDMKFTWKMDEDDMKYAAAMQREIFDYAVRTANSRKYDILIMDEIMPAISYGFIEISDVVDFLKNKPDSLEVVLTGRDAPPKLIEMADYVSEVKAIKHPSNKDVWARKGIEY